MTGCDVNYVVSGDIAGEWMEDRLYLVDVEQAKYLILSTEASYLVHQIVETGSSRLAETAFQNFFGHPFPAASLEVLVSRQVLVADDQGETPMIAARPDYDGKPEADAEVIIEEGNVQTRIVATSISAPAPPP